MLRCARSKFCVEQSNKLNPSIHNTHNTHNHSACRRACAARASEMSTRTSSIRLTCAQQYTLSTSQDCAAKKNYMYFTTHTRRSCLCVYVLWMLAVMVVELNALALQTQKKHSLRASQPSFACQQGSMLKRPESGLCAAPLSSARRAYKVRWVGGGHCGLAYGVIIN